MTEQTFTEESDRKTNEKITCSLSRVLASSNNREQSPVLIRPLRTPVPFATVRYVIVSWIIKYFFLFIQFVLILFISTHLDRD